MHSATFSLDILWPLPAAASTTADVPRRVEALVGELRALQEKLELSVQRGAENDVRRLVEGAEEVNGAKVAAGTIETASPETLRAFGDRLRDHLGTGIGVVGARVGDRYSLLAVVTDDLIAKGVRADEVVREVAKLAGGSGGGRPHMAQGSTSGPERTAEALAQVVEIVRPMLEPASR